MSINNGDLEDSSIGDGDNEPEVTILTEADKKSVLHNLRGKDIILYRTVGSEVDSYAVCVASVTIHGGLDEVELLFTQPTFDRLLDDVMDFNELPDYVTEFDHNVNRSGLPNTLPVDLILAMKRHYPGMQRISLDNNMLWRVDENSPPGRPYVSKTITIEGLPQEVGTYVSGLKIEVLNTEMLDPKS